jgi:hypothetical protein
MVAIYCRSDCQFSQNIDRLCTLKLVEVSQGMTYSPGLTCSQYTRADKLSENARATDLDRSRAAGLYAGLDKRLRNG